MSIGLAYRAADGLTGADPFYGHRHPDLDVSAVGNLPMVCTITRAEFLVIGEPDPEPHSG